MRSDSNRINLSFDPQHREPIVTNWHRKCIEHQIHCSATYSLVESVAEAAAIREWTNCGVPVDNHSIENAIILTTAKRYPLVIDPQDRAGKWIKNAERSNSLKTICINSAELTAALRDAVTSGNPILIDEIGKHTFQYSPKVDN